MRGLFLGHVRPLFPYRHVRPWAGHLFLDSRAKHGNDRGEEKNTEKTEEKKRTREWQGKNKSTGMTVLFFLLSSSDKRSAFRGSLDIRITRSAWRYGWMSGASPNMTERKISPGMTIFFSYALLLISLLFCMTKINMVPSLVDRKICSFINSWLFPQIRLC